MGTGEGDGVEVGEELAIVLGLGERVDPGGALKLGLAPNDGVGETAGAGLEQPTTNATKTTIERWARTPQ